MAAETHAAAHHEPHVLPLKVYYTVWVTLLFFTVLTYAVSYLDLGPASIWVALLVAFIKASLVSAFFMHLKYDDKFHTFIFTCTLIFVAIFFAFVLMDLGARDAILREQGNYALIQDRATAKAKEEAEKAKQNPAPAPAALPAGH